MAEFGDGGGVAWCGQRIKPDVQGVVVGDDVAGAGQTRLPEFVGIFRGRAERMGW